MSDIIHYTVVANDGWLSIARKLAPTGATSKQIQKFAQDTAVANGASLTTPLYVGRVLHVDEATIPVVVTPPPPPPPVEPPPTNAPLWSDEFATLEMSTPSQAKTWLPNEFDINHGYEDFAGQNWNANPNQAPGYNPFSIVTSDGRTHLRITCKRRPPEMDQVTSEDWVSGYMITNPALRTFTYGYFEAELRLPNLAKGAFPSFWLYGTDSQREIDIFEVFGEASGKFYGTVHETNQGPSATVMSSDRDLRDWHRIGFDWQPGYLRWFYDGVQIHEYTGPLLTKFNRPMSIRLNHAMVPQSWGTWNAPDASTPSPMFYDVNYVRYWATKP